MGSFSSTLPLQATCSPLHACRMCISTKALVHLCKQAASCKLLR